MPIITKPYGDFTNNLDVVDAVKVNQQYNTLYNAINGGLDAQNVPTLGDVTTLTTTAKSSAVAAVNEINANRAKQTTAAITLYVDAANGNDGNAGTSAGTGALKTVTAAVNKLPQIINHTVTINVAAGTYNDNVILTGYVGSGSINLIGSNSYAGATSYTVNYINVLNCGCDINIQGFALSVTATDCLYVSETKYAKFTYMQSSTTGSGAGLRAAKGSVVNVNNSGFSNKTQGVLAELGAIIYSDTNSGSGNGTGLYSYQGAQICKNSTQPGGTTAEYSTSGGNIR